MERTTELSLIDRVHAHLKSKSTDTDEPGGVAVRDYTDSARYALEHQRLFGGRPVAIGHASMVREPGDFFTHDALGRPLVVVRGDDGQVRAFLNVCRHRGTQLVSGAGRGARAFACPYHAWTYDRAGRLTGVPHPRGFPQLDRRERGLVAVPTAVAGGLVFVTLSGDRCDAAADLGEIALDLDGLDLGAQHVYAPQHRERALNWKLGIDIFLETYHLRTTHAQSIYPMFFDNVGLVDRLGPHQRNVFPKRTIAELEPGQRESWALRQHANILYHLFPNTLILVQPDHMAVLHLFPRNAVRTVIQSYTLVPAPPDDQAKRYWDANNAILYGATDEDYQRGESIQIGLSSGANEDFLFADFEHSLTHFHRRVSEAVER